MPTGEMKTILDDCVNEAKAYQNPEQRRWLFLGRADSYSAVFNRVQCYVLEGSPARGFILVLGQHVVRLDGQGKRLKTWDIVDKALARIG